METILEKYYGFKSLKKEQKEIIDCLLNGNDCIGLLPTGYGKSLCFQVPALVMDGITIVITPLIALMQDQVRNLRKRGIEAYYINSLQSAIEQREVHKNICSNKAKIIYVSAERLESKQFILQMRNVKIALIVCDEAHTLLWSEDFRLALGHIPNFIEKIGYRPVHLALTATATSITTEKITKYLKLKKPKVVVGNVDRENIYYKIIRTNHKLKEVVSIISKHKGELGIIYCLTIKNVNYLYKYLINMGYRVGLYHGCLDSTEKIIMQNNFSNHIIDVIICTNAFGMGVDIPDIRYVIEYDLPICIEDYVQQSGRGSRDGKPAVSYLLFSVDDIKTANYFIEHLSNSEKSEAELEEIRKEKYKKLDKMIDLALTRGCIHKYICNYFGQKHNGKCGMCSNCR